MLHVLPLLCDGGGTAHAWAKTRSFEPTGSLQHIPKFGNSWHFVPLAWNSFTSKGTILEIRSTRSFNAIPATLIRGVFKLYLNLLCKFYCKCFIYLFIYLFIQLFALSFPFNHCNFTFYLWQIYTYLLWFIISKSLCYKQFLISDCSRTLFLRSFCCPVALAMESISYICCF